MAGQIGHRELAGAIGRTCAVSGPQRSKSACCSKVHGSYPARTIVPVNFTRPSVRTRRGSHPAPSGRPPRGGAKVTWFRYSCEYLGYSREDPGRLITQYLSTFCPLVPPRYPILARCALCSYLHYCTQDSLTARPFIFGNCLCAHDCAL